uniref:Uncharacterized protein n=1 Tax=Xiphophorus couchianus TaxID=32473 RepID=A0A3B5KYC1_9TELE
LTGNEYGLTEATKGLTNLDLREQELKDMEVARRLQEEELKRMSHMKERAAQVAKDEASFNKALFYIFLVYFFVFVLSSESLPVHRQT